jgi:hypothetical protein
MMIWNERLSAREREKSETGVMMLDVFFRVPLASLEIGRILVLIVKMEFEGIERYFSKLLQKCRPVQKRLWKPGTQQVPRKNVFCFRKFRGFLGFVSRLVEDAASHCWNAIDAYDRRGFAVCLQTLLMRRLQISRWKL